ncbi:MAG TPA: hypothetical protein VMB72_03105, partial [Acidimicrobiales bacterium]|nr:hypothetical protein [Acidimicrobiales bacterium]
MAVTLPYFVLLVRVLAWSGPVDLSGDLAMVDLAVRNAAHFHQTLGAYDRFGWHHPGPAYFYLLAIPSWILGAGGRSEVVGTVVINGACALGVWWVVRRQTGTAASWWAAACLGLLGMALTSTGSTFATVQEPLGILASPWNPYVVVMPLVLCT